MKKLSVFLFLLGLLTACAGQDHLNQGKKLLEEQKYAEAESVLLKATTDDPANPDAWNCLATAYLQQSKIEESFRSFDKSVALARDKNLSPVELGRLCFDRGVLFYVQGNYENAKEDFATAVKGGYKLGESNAYLGTSVGYLGDDIAALRYLNDAVKADPQNHFAWSNRGYYNSKVGDNKTAIFDLSKAIELQPEDKVSYLNRGYTYLGMEDFDAALKDFDKSLDLDPDYLGAIAYKGIVLTNSGHPDQALPWLDRAISLQPDNPAFYYYRGAARISVEMFDSACVDLARAAAGGHMDGEGMRRQYCK